MRNNQVTKFLILFVFVFLCSCDLFKSMCEAEKPPKQSTTLQQIVNDTNAGETIDLEKYSNEYDITDYNAEISKNLTIKNGSFQNTTLKIKAEVKLEKVQELSVETSANLTIRDSKLNNLLLGTNAESRSTNSGNTNFDLKVIVKNCEIAEKIKINSKAKLNIAGEKTKIAKIVVAVAAEVCKILCTTEVDTKKIENVITDENGEKPEEIKITQAYKITYHSNCDELEDIEDFFSPDDGTISLPTDIFKRNEYIFAGWYEDKNCTQIFDNFDVSKTTADINVYAGWTKYIPGSGVYKYESKIGNLIFEWGGGFSVLLLTDEQLEVCNDAKDFKQATAEKPEYQIAAFGDMIVDTTKEGNFAVYGRNGSKYDGVAVTIKDNTFTLFIDMTKLTKTQLKGLWKDTGNGDEAFITEDDTVNLTGYKPYVIALTTQDKDVNNFKFRAWDADLMAMTGNATFPTNLQQSAPTTGNTNEVKELTATADTVADTIRNLSAGTYMLKISGEITSTTITTIATAMNSNTEAKINLDLSDTDGLTEIPENAFHIDNTHNDNLISIIIPNSVESIDYQAFSDCSSLTSVTIPNNVTSIGGYAFFNCSSLTNITIGSGITSIGVYAFRNCSSLTNITIGSKVNTINDGAFAGCSNLTNFEVDAGNTNYSSLENGKILCDKNQYILIAYPSATGDITIPDGVTTIGKNAFCYHRSSLKNITIPDGCTYIGSYAFLFCSSLTSVTFNNTNNWYYTNNENYTGGTAINVTDTAQNADNLKDTYSGYYWYRPTELTATADTVAATINGLSAGTYTLKVSGEITSTTITTIANAMNNNTEAKINLDLSGANGVTTIDNYAFSNCSSLTRITIPNSVTSIGVQAFFFCSSLTEITIPDSVTSIREEVFSNCSSLASIEIPDSVTTIGTSAFFNCSSLTSIKIGSSVTSTSIDGGTFGGCYNLAKFEVDANNPNYSTSAEGIILFNGDKTELIAYHRSAVGYITIPDGVTSIGDHAFSDCSSLTSITIPDGVKSIGEYAFSNCSSLISIEIPNSVTSIADGAFSYCSSLTSIEIPDDVTSIGEYAFSYCSSLTSIEIPDSVTTIGLRAFSGCSGLTSIEIPNSVTTIGDYAFSYCENLTSVTFADTTSTWYYTESSDYTGGTAINVTDTAQNADNLKDTYSGYYWYKESSTGGTTN